MRFRLTRQEGLVNSLALLLVVLGLVLARTGQHVAGTVIAVLGAVIIVVLFGRKLLFRP